MDSVHVPHTWVRLVSAMDEGLASHQAGPICPVGCPGHAAADPLRRGYLTPRLATRHLPCAPGACHVPQAGPGSGCPSGHEPWSRCFPGDSRLRLRPEGPAEAETEALQQADPSGRLPHSGEGTRRGRAVGVSHPPHLSIHSEIPKLLSAVMLGADPSRGEMQTVGPRQLVGPGARAARLPPYRVLQRVTSFGEGRGTGMRPDQLPDRGLSMGLSPPSHRSRPWRLVPQPPSPAPPHPCSALEQI